MNNVMFPFYSEKIRIREMKYFAKVMKQVVMKPDFKLRSIQFALNFCYAPSLENNKFSLV